MRPGAHCGRRTAQVPDASPSEGIASMETEPKRLDAGSLWAAAARLFRAANENHASYLTAPVEADALGFEGETDER